MKAGKSVLTGVLTGIMALTLLVGVPMGKDGEVNAERRTLKGLSANSEGIVTWDCVYFGSYPQSDATGQKKEPIKWRVLSVEGNDALLMADQNLDVQRYNDKQMPVTWETCTMRSWLNGYGGSSNICGTDYSSSNFINRAFTASEQGAILTVTVVSGNNPEYGTAGGNDTQDKIFLLSYDDVTNPAYGFSSDYEAKDTARIRRNTAYVVDRRSVLPEDYADWWWLRSSGITQSKLSPTYAMYVYGNGVVRPSGLNVNCNLITVCPALHLDLSFSELWADAGTVSSDGISTGCLHENTEFRAEKEATCTEDGYTGDIYCSDCGARIESGEEIPSEGGHQWDDGIITKQATATEDAVKTFTCTECGETRTETVLGTADLVTDTTITTQTTEDVKGAVFNALQARSTKLTKSSVTLKWKKVQGADGYKVYGNRCGKKNRYKLIKDIGKNKTSYTQKKLKKGTYYKYVVAAYKVVDGEEVTMTVSKTIHATTTGGKYGVAKSVKVNKSKITLKKGGKFTIKAKEVKKDKTIRHHRKIAYESSNTEVATVSKKGVVKAKKKGSCYIYVYAQNGVYKRVKITVK